MNSYLSEEELIDSINKYINPIKEKAYRHTYLLSHPVLNKNPYTSDFHQSMFKNKQVSRVTFFITVKGFIVYLIKNFLFFLFFITTAILRKVFYRKDVLFDKKSIIIDSFLLPEKVLKSGSYQELYFQNLEDILIKRGYKPIYMPRLYIHTKNIFSVGKLLEIIQKDKNDFLLESDCLTFFDYFKLIKFILLYPFYHFSIRQKETSLEDRYFNNALLRSLQNVTFESYARYLLGKGLAQRHDNLKILSWCEFQNMEKNFYKAVNESEKNITVYGCQFLIQYRAYQSMFIDSIDKELGISPTKVLTNGRYYSNQINQANGISLRYKGLFEFYENKKVGGKNIALLSYNIEESRSMLKKLSDIEGPLLIKIHPATSEGDFIDLLKARWKFTYGPIYELFYLAKLAFVAPMSGTALEAVALGIAVIIIGDENSMFVNPLCKEGQGQIWDVVFSQNELMKVYNDLLKYKKDEPLIASRLSKWYKDNFFIEPTEENIIKAFELEKEET